MPGFAARAASLAEEAGLTKTCFHWSEFAGAEADLPSMRRLVSSSAASPTLETWTWIYLSRNRTPHTLLLISPSPASSTID